MPKKGSFDSLQIKGGLGKKEGGGVFEGGVDNSTHTMIPSFLIQFVSGTVYNILSFAKYCFSFEQSAAEK